MGIYQGQWSLWGQGIILLLPVKNWLSYSHSEISLCKTQSPIWNILKWVLRDLHLNFIFFSALRLPLFAGFSALWLAAIGNRFGWQVEELLGRDRPSQQEWSRKGYLQSDFLREAWPIRVWVAETLHIGELWAHAEDLANLLAEMERKKPVGSSRFHSKILKSKCWFMQIRKTLRSVRPFSF